MSSSQLFFQPRNLQQLNHSSATLKARVNPLHDRLPSYTATRSVSAQTKSTPAAPASTPATPNFFWKASTPTGAAAAVLCTWPPDPLALDWLVLPELGLDVSGVLSVVPLPDGLANETLNEDDDMSSVGIETLNSSVMVGAGAKSAEVARRFWVEASLSTVKGSPHDDVWADARDRREKLKRVAVRILRDSNFERKGLGRRF
jgi:hypothetical protein